MRKVAPRSTFLKDYRPTPFLVDQVQLTFRLHETATVVRARYHFRPNRKATGKTQQLVLDGEKLSLRAIVLDGNALSENDYALNETHLVLHRVPRRKFELVIETTCNPAANTALSGLYISNGVYCTQCEAEGFRRITYGYDRPDVMARYRVRIEAPVAVPVLLSNGNPTATGSLDEVGWHYAEWDDPHPKPSYLFALVAGDLSCVKDQFTTMDGRVVQLGIYVEKGKENRCGWAMQSLKAAMRWDEQVFRRAYDLDVFNIVAVSDFNMGAMENKGLNIFNDKYILALPETATDTDFELIEAIIAHEYFHNWTGNRITCRDWFQLCLKEGLTVFRDQEFTSDLRSRAVKRIEDVQDLRSRQFPEDMGPLQHPARPSSYIEINNFYTATVYEKGAELCRMMKVLIGDKAFAKAMQLYFKRHDGEAATVEDFVSCMADASGRDLKHFFRWYTQAGTPVLKVAGVYDAKRKTYRLTVKQSVPRRTGETARKPLHIPLRLGLIGPDGADMALRLRGQKPMRSSTLEFKRAAQEFVFVDVPAKPTLSINRGFSAPIVIAQKGSADERAFLIGHDGDSFNRWDAAQGAALDLIIARYHARKPNLWPKLAADFSAALDRVLRDGMLDDAFKAKMLELPDFSELMAALGKDIDCGKLFQATEDLRRTCAQNLNGTLQETVDQTAQVGPYAPDAASTGKRSLRYAALGLAAAGLAPWAIATVRADFADAQNMTAEYSALRIATRFHEPVAEDMLNVFYQRHAQDHLLIDKWFAAQAMMPGVNASARVRRLMAHDAFNLKTPNRVYALIRNFIGGNVTGFHAADGAGYELAGDAILALDVINPQVASRLATGFRTWRMLNAPRRAKAQSVLQRILQTQGLSKDVHEIISRTLRR